MLRLGANQLEGTLDDFAAALGVDNALADFNVSDNKLTGPVPDALKVRGLVLGSEDVQKEFVVLSRDRGHIEQDWSVACGKSQMARSYPRHPAANRKCLMPVFGPPMAWEDWPPSSGSVSWCKFMYRHQHDWARKP